MKHYISIFVAALFFAGSTSWAGDVRSKDLPDPDAVQAFQNFWQSFEDYERATMLKAKRQYQVQWNRIKAELQVKEEQANRTKINNLKEAESKYKDHLREYPEADNRPYVMLNLAQILNMIADTYGDNSDAANQHRQQALSVLKEITAEFPAFDKRAETLYLRAIIFESLNFDRDARVIWRQLADTDNPSIFTVYANLALGDYYFDREEPANAVPYYKIAMRHLKGVEAKNLDYETLRVQYRLAWAAYRSADLDLAISSALPLLQPGRSLPSEDQRKNIQQDAVELVGDTLFEYDDMSRTKTTLKLRDLGEFSEQIGSRILRRYYANNMHEQAAELGQFMVKEYPLSAAVPDWLNMTAGVLHTLKRQPEEIEALERLAILLPKQSLWRSKHRDDYEAIRNMEKLAMAGAKATAAYHYDHGLASGNKNSFMQAAAFYTILIEYEPQSEEANQWRARRAHCNYFGGKLEKADELYTELKEKYKLNPDTLEASSYQQVMTRRKRWMESFSKAAEAGLDPKSSPDAIASLRSFIESVNQFANRFPHRNRSVDLLLMAGSANSDHGYFDKASQYWERVLISKPTTHQRADAIRGLIAATVRNGDAGELVKLSRRFLKLEDWGNEGLSLGEELKGVLSTAALDESQRLNNEGEIIEAGALLVQLAQEFKDLPRREKIYRDGAYMLAIAGDWPSAEQAAAAYLKEDLRQNAGDMQYLLARAAEFQVRFAEASRGYIELGRRFPKHTRALTSLKRAENLAIAENTYSLAGESAEMIGDRLKKRSQRLAAYESAYQHYEKAEDTTSALKVAEKRRQISQRLDDKLLSELMSAKSRVNLGEEKTALASIETIASRARKSKKLMRSTVYQQVAGEAYLMLGTEARRFFTTFNMFERQGGLAANLRVKTRYFETLTKNFDYAAAAESPEFSTHARYLLAQSAEEFADEMRSIENRIKVSSDAKEKYRQTAQRLDELAKKYHGNNLLVKNRNPKLYKNNEWVQKSAIKLTGYGAGDFKPEGHAALPDSVNIQLPQQWSL